jgi:hypothetical protein
VEEVEGVEGVEGVLRGDTQRDDGTQNDVRMIDRLEAQASIPGYCARATERGRSCGRRVARGTWHVALAM